MRVVAVQEEPGGIVVVIAPEPGVSLLDIVRLEASLERELGVPVRVVVKR